MISLPKLHIDIKRVIILATMLIFFTILTTAVFYPDSFLLDFTYNSVTQTILRSVVLVTLLILLVSHPPRPVIVRAILCLISIAILGAAIVSTFEYKLGLLDSALYLEVSIIFGIEALETKYSQVRKSKRVRKQLLATT